MTLCIVNILSPYLGRVWWDSDAAMLHFHRNPDQVVSTVTDHESGESRDVYMSVSDSHVQGVVRLPERVREGAEHGGHTVLD